jgi:hypothetical protein
MSAFVMTPIEIHQLEGFDPQARSFNRNVDVYRSEKGFSCRFQYEGFTAESGLFVTIPDALTDIVKKIHEKGFRNVRTRINFRGKRYFAERQAWVDYGDPQ